MTPDPEDRITSLAKLDLACHQRRSVFVPKSRVWGKPRPAAFIISLQARMVLRMLREGLYIYHAAKPAQKGQEQ